jgi:hypothetical protein
MSDWCFDIFFISSVSSLHKHLVSLDRWYARAVSSGSLPATLVRRYDSEGGTHAQEYAQVLFGLGVTLQAEVTGHAC